MKECYIWPNVMEEKVGEELGAENVFGGEEEETVSYGGDGVKASVL